MGHSLTDGSGRDTYIKLRPDSKAFVKPSKKLVMGNERRARPHTEYRDVFVPETASSKPYVPTALSYFQLKMMSGFAQKAGDHARFTIRRSDVLRRDAEESARLLKLSRQNIMIDPMQTRARNKLQRTLLPVLERSAGGCAQKPLLLRPPTAQASAGRGEADTGPFLVGENAIITVKPQTSATSGTEATLRAHLGELNQEAMRASARTSSVLRENATANTLRAKIVERGPVQDGGDILVSPLPQRDAFSAAGTYREGSGAVQRKRRSAAASSDNALTATDGYMPIRSGSAIQVASRRAVCHVSLSNHNLGGHISS